MVETCISAMAEIISIKAISLVDVKMYKIDTSIFTTCKWSLGQVNVFTPVCQSFCSQGEGVLWCHSLLSTAPPLNSTTTSRQHQLPRQHPSPGQHHPQTAPPQDSTTPLDSTTPGQLPSHPFPVNKWWYASYWKAFLFWWMLVVKVNNEEIFRIWAKMVLLFAETLCNTHSA